MELRQLPPFSLERWFAEFEFVQGMRAFRSYRFWLWSRAFPGGIDYLAGSSI